MLKIIHRLRINFHCKCAFCSVVVGAALESNANILYIRIIEAKLLSTGAIDPNSLSYSLDIPRKSQLLS